MIRVITLVFAFALSATGVKAEPSSHPTRTEAGPTPPQSLVIVACRVEDLTGQPGRHDPRMAAGNWRDLSLVLNESLEYECKRERLDLEDSVVMHAPSRPFKTMSDVSGQLYAGPLSPNFSNWGQCVRVGAMQAAMWTERHPGWGVVAVGCPIPVMDDNGTPDYWGDDRLIGWHMPSCPTYLPGTNNRMRCNFDESAI